MSTASISTDFPVVFSDFPNPNMFAIGVFFYGCDFKCYKCQNPELQKSGGEKFTPQELLKELDYRIGNLDMGIALMGGDPLAEENRDFTADFLSINKRAVIIYTGYELDNIKNMIAGRRILAERNFTYIKTGVFKYHLRQQPELTDKYFQLASSNQAIYDSDLKKLTIDGRYNFG